MGFAWNPIAEEQNTILYVYVTDVQQNDNIWATVQWPVASHDSAARII